ncbi:hypothetical protein [Clostridium thailandense]|uniref:hypothetical protein n=1 Tax=Clostridium thailandense TaxID=2794346 RepID=UPI00398966F6
MLLEEYIKNEFIIMGIIGNNRSPSCGVDTTSKNDQEVAGEGVFIEILRKKLEKNINIDMVGIKVLETEKALIDIQRLINTK